MHDNRHHLTIVSLHQPPSKHPWATFLSTRSQVSSAVHTKTHTNMPVRQYTNRLHTKALPYRGDQHTRLLKDEAGRIKPNANQYKFNSSQDGVFGANPTIDITTDLSKPAASSHYMALKTPAGMRDHKIRKPKNPRVTHSQTIHATGQGVSRAEPITSAKNNVRRRTSRISGRLLSLTQHLYYLLS